MYQELKIIEKLYSIFFLFFSNDIDIRNNRYIHFLYHSNNSATDSDKINKKQYFAPNNFEPKNNKKLKKTEQKYHWQERNK